jgi:hypothetical protein
MRLLSLSLSAVLAAVPALPVLAHEFFVQPQAYTISQDQPLMADIRVGQQFKGSAYSYIPQNTVRFDLVIGDSVIPVQARVGDRPALNMPAPREGLVTVVHQTTDSFLTYSDPAKFEQFVTHKDFAWALDENKKRGIPEIGFRERYSRYGKALIAVGSGAGMDREVGMETEIVALANPYTDDLAGGMPVLVLYQGKPRVDTQVEVFARAPDAAVTDSFYRTNADGIATIPVEPGVEYLFDAVVMRPLEPVAENDPVWESLWASLTFMVPPQP